MDHEPDAIAGCRRRTRSSVISKHTVVASACIGSTYPLSSEKPAPLNPKADTSLRFLPPNGPTWSTFGPARAARAAVDILPEPPADLEAAADEPGARSPILPSCAPSGCIGDARGCIGVHGKPPALGVLPELDPLQDVAAWHRLPEQHLGVHLEAAGLGVIASQPSARATWRPPTWRPPTWRPPALMSCPSSTGRASA